MAVHYDRSRRLAAMRTALLDWSSTIDAAAERARRALNGVEAASAEDAP